MIASSSAITTLTGFVTGSEPYPELVGSTPRCAPLRSLRCRLPRVAAPSSCMLTGHGSVWRLGPCGTVMSVMRHPIFTAEHDELRAAVRRFVTTEVRPHVETWERAGSF